MSETSNGSKGFNQPCFFNGKVLPERAHAYFNIQKQHARLQDREIEFSALCFGSQIVGSITSSSGFDNLLHASTVANLVLRNIVDRLSFANFCGYDVEVTSIISGEESEILGVFEPVFFDTPEQQAAFTRKELPFFSPVQFTPAHPRLDHALRCFNHGLRDRALTTFFCFLAIETVARMICEVVRGVEVPRVQEAEWLLFRESLQVRRETIDDDVKKLSDHFRHGDFVNTSWPERKKAMSLTWNVIARAMQVLTTGQSLSAEVFPPL
ncbi:MAG: hypothetical protein WDM94_11440 [Bauldia sp.]